MAVRNDCVPALVVGLGTEFVAVSASAERICRKRARGGDQARSVVATRGDILFSTDTAEFRAPSVQGLQLLDRFERFLERVDELYMSRSVSQRFSPKFHHSVPAHIVGAQSGKSTAPFFSTGLSSKSSRPRSW